MDEEERGGVSFGEIIHAIGKKIWIILGASALVAVIAVLLFQFLINPGKIKYSLSFSIDYPDWQTLQYPDGTKFNYKEIISLESLEAVKNSDDRFAAIDVENMVVTKDAIAIEAEEEEVDVQYGKEKQFTGNYTLTITKNYFDSSDIAYDFLRALASAPINYVKDSVGKAYYLFNLDAYSAVKTYEEKINYLRAQKDYLLEKYDTFIRLYGENYEVSGKTLRALRVDVQTTFDSITESKLRTELKDKGYIFDKADISVTQVSIASLKREKEYNEKEILRLKQELDELVKIYGTAPSDTSTTIQYETFNQRIVSLVTRNNQIDKELEVLENSISPDAPSDEAFATELTQHCSDLETLTNTYQKVAVALYSFESETRFEPMVADSEGSTSILLVAIAGFILVFALVSFIFCCRDIPKYRREEEALAKANEGPQIAEPTETEKTE